MLGNITTLTSGASQQYRYDAIQRLTRVDNASLQRIDAWTYDGTGNRLSRQAGQGPLLTLSYPPTSHRVSVASVARSYDANGNTTARGSESLFYGDHNRLVTWSSAFGMSNASYRHNARGERVMKTSLIGTASMIGEEVPPNCLAVEGQSVQTFLYDESGRLIRDSSDPAPRGRRTTSSSGSTTCRLRSSTPTPTCPHRSSSATSPRTTSTPRAPSATPPAQQIRQTLGAPQVPPAPSNQTSFQMQRPRSPQAGLQRC